MQSISLYTLQVISSCNGTTKEPRIPPLDLDELGRVAESDKISTAHGHVVTSLESEMVKAKCKSSSCILTFCPL